MIPFDREMQDQEELKLDRDRLDWLQKQLEKAVYTGACVFRWSTSGRGWRLHETSEEAKERFGIDPVGDVRIAIDEAIRRETNDSSGGWIEGDSETKNSGASS